MQQDFYKQRKAARLAEAAAQGFTELGKPGVPTVEVESVQTRSTPPAEPELRYFSLPDCATDPWDPQYHGVESDEDDDGAKCCWRPGCYSFSLGSGAGNELELCVPEHPAALYPSQRVLRAMHGLLSDLYPDL